MSVQNPPPPLQEEPLKSDRNPKAEAKAAKAYAKAQRPWYKKKRYILSISLALLIAIIAITSSGGGDDASTPADQADGAGGSSQADAPSNKATNDHTPHVGANGSVIVDTLTWRISGAYTAPTIGENQFATETADGVYVAVALSVTNGKEESVTLQSGMITLAAGSSRYESDSEGTFAASIDGEETFFLKDLGPAVSTNGTVVFDVAPAALQRRPEICFGELGFGSSEGCIRLVV